MLQKIAFDQSATYLTKTAMFADALAQGHSPDDIIKYAELASIDIDDVQSMHDEVYGDALKKVADEQDGMTPLMKTAELADAFVAGVPEQEILKVAYEEGVALDDINAMVDLFGLDGTAGLDKTAEAENAIADVLESSASDLTKIAALAEGYQTGVLSAQETEQVAHNYGVDFTSVCEVANA